MQDLNDMLYFAEVVERGGFAAAGRALGLPKSRLSRRVAALEAQLGVRLLQRTTRKLSLTEVGEAYLRHCQALRESAQAAADTVAQVQTEPRGTLRVACPVTLAQTMLAELMPDFLARHPLVRVEMLVSNRVVDLVEEGVDVALRVRTTLDDSGSLVIKRLGDDAPVLVASPALLARQGTPATLEELGRLDSMAMSTTDGRASVRLTGPDGRETTVQHTPRYVADDLLTLHVAALAGTGMCWLPSYMCEDDLRQGRLVRLLPDWQPPRGIVHAVFPSRRGLTPAVRRFLDFLGEQVPTHSRLLGRDAADSVT
ncbi:LysR family transcriptional regulator [Hydrogenophaga sp.]|jgi:DNA-binding transcriptional LysR family regulator|uniref:LysR family transcriptional regulator n=1 Tax=Hydrogenophaga sp. TaxID=1904254 RepID=UPI00271AFFDD|nr:LysR family transcriptional regulator [Hydrogenophaga sp.]MDO9132049.1 LysR family transcriptional regulator [Hydrogenophaga sp.]MDP3325346.1 LysR family transcriptional regulator [Hydrogenophaga sp.]MDP3887240.1 LysR family transcriptional regulator [Hydrogenophaga sp.]